MATNLMLGRLVGRYLSSRDFNGVPARAVAEGADDEARIEAIASELRAENVTLVFGDHHPNPHIKAFSPEPVEEQLEKLHIYGLAGAFVYPSRKTLEGSSEAASLFQTEPYTMELAMGASQLDFRAFELAVLETYRNDPRYYFHHDDTTGSLSLSDDYYNSDAIHERDKVSMQSFGFCFDEDLNRYAAVWLRDLMSLSPGHQQRWRTYEVGGSFKLHPDFYKQEILGEWGEGISVFEALLYELYNINRLCETIGRSPLFRKDYRGERPREFGFLVRPTQREYDDFMQILDKMLSDNISKDFFQGEVSGEREVPRDDGRVEVKTKGTLQMLEEWIGTRFRLPPTSQQAVDEMMSALKQIRKQRSKPAHTIVENTYEQSLLVRQRELMSSTWKGIRNLRLLLQNHPAASGFALDPSYEDLRVWMF